MLQEKTRRRNIFAVVQTRDLDNIRPKIETALRKFDAAAFEVMPGFWHLAVCAPASAIRDRLAMTVTDWEDDRVLVIDNPDGWAAWDGLSGQYVRHPELKKAWVRTNDIRRGKSERWRQAQLGQVSQPEWLKKKIKTGTRLT